MREGALGIIRSAICVCAWVGGTFFAHAVDEMTAIDQLAQQHLRYVYGSEDLHNGGLDCSGFVQIVFWESQGIELPNEADKQLDYCRAHGQVWDSTSGWTPATLQPGDLIFIAGPYDLPRESRVTHVMIYCGHNTMAGAQGEGRQEDGAYSGVGYYRFLSLPPSGISGESGERFIGHRRIFAYGRIGSAPGVTAPATPAPIVATTVAKAHRFIRTASLASRGFKPKPFGANSRID